MTLLSYHSSNLSSIALETMRLLVQIIIACSFDKQMKFNLCFLILSSILHFASLEFTLRCFHKYDLVRKKKENAKVLRYALGNIRMISVIL